MVLGRTCDVIVRTCGPGLLSFAVLLALACSSSDGSSGGCSSEEAAFCEIDAEATVCGDRITVLCFDGESPEAMSQCDLALRESGEAIYCCTSAVEEELTEADTEADGEGAAGGIVSVGGEGGGGGGGR